MFEDSRAVLFLKLEIAKRTGFRQSGKQLLIKH